MRRTFSGAQNAPKSHFDMKNVEEIFAKTKRKTHHQLAWAMSHQKTAPKNQKISEKRAKRPILSLLKLAISLMALFNHVIILDIFESSVG